MSKLQTPEEILEEVYDLHIEPNSGYVWSHEDAVAAIKEAQRQAVQYALKKAAEEGRLEEFYYDGEDGGRKVMVDIDVKMYQPQNLVGINQRSILSLESQILKDLGHE